MGPSGPQVFVPESSVGTSAYVGIVGPERGTADRDSLTTSVGLDVLAFIGGGVLARE